MVITVKDGAATDTNTPELLKRADAEIKLPAAPKEGSDLQTIIADANQQTPAVGQRVVRVDARAHGLGRTEYIDDMTWPNQLFAKVKRAEIAHARIKSVDVSEAAKMPGVKATLVGAEIPVNSFGPSLQDQPLINADKVHHVGDPVAAVAAETEQQCIDALKKIKVEYEPLTPIFNPIDAMKEGATQVHDGKSNIYASKQIKKGDVEKAFAECDHIFEDSFSTQMIEHVPLEPHASAATWDVNGRLLVWSSLGRITLGRADLSRILQVPYNKIRVTATIVGGNFGGKNELTVEPILALLAKKTDRPVRHVYTREDEFMSSTTRHPFYMDYKTGVMNDGKIVARKIKIVCDGGAYCSWSETTMGKGCILAAGPYNIDNLEVNAYAVYTNKVMTGAMRGFGAPQVCFAYESHMDDIAHELGIDPLEIRMRNAFHEGSSSPTGQQLASVAVRESLKMASERAGWKEN
jgi:nicotinate dehydrogenase large molybdopterin subunit